MITPRRTRLHRTAGLQGFQEALAALTRTGDPWRARNTAVLVPTRAAAARLRRTLEELTLLGGPRAPVLVFPEVLSRADWYALLAARLARPAALLSATERYVCMLAAAREAAARGAAPPFNLRPGLVPAIVGFYDDLLRQQGTVDSFERLVVADLEPSAELDRGARRLLRQTRFLVAALRAFERRMARTGRPDEHALRRRAVDEGLARPLVHVVVAVADHAADPDGLWPADFDLLARLPALERIDVVATEALLRAGLHERLTALLPGLDEERFAGAAEQAPVLVAPAGAAESHFVRRDREAELLGVVRWLKSRRTRPGDARPDGAVDGAEAVVFQRPLPYLYLARQSFAQAGVPFETHAALPLAAEPYAAALDLVVEFVTSDYGRSAAVELLRSPHFAFEDDGRPLPADAVEALDLALHEVRYAGGRTALRRLAEAWAGADGAAAPRPPGGGAARVAARLAAELRPLEAPGPPAAQLEVVASFLRRHRSGGAAPAAAREREARARAAITTGLAALERAYRALDDMPIAFPELMQSVRRWIETQTFTPAAGTGGVQLVDARVAPYGRFRELFLVGLVDGEWPARPARSVFYPAAVLAGLGWWAERDRFRAARARFTDLVRSARERVSLSAPALEDDVVAAPSVLLDPEQLAGLDLATEREPAPRQACVTPDEALLRAAVVPAGLPGPAGPWLALRRRRPAPDERFRGLAGATRGATYAVSALERYLACPFRYFARHELELAEEAADEPVLAPRQRGRFLHRVLETFFAAWQAAGRGAVTPAHLDQALDLFGTLVEAALGDLPPVDRAVARTWLNGSAAAPGLAEQLLQLEVSRPVDVVERLVEVRLDRTYRVHGPGPGADPGPDPGADPGPDPGLVPGRAVRVRGTADRIDLLSDGTFRIVDYKLDRAPRRERALQLPVYARCAEQRLDGYRQRAWHAGDAAYVAFGEPGLHVPLARGDLDRALSEGEDRAVGALAQIARGAYPARPAERRLCTHCPYPTVCRKDYVGE